MLDVLQSILLIFAIIAASLLFLFFVHRLWPAEQRRLQNDLIGWQITVLGTTYAVIIGFMLYAVWTNFQTADSNAEAEANSLVNMVRSADGLPEGPRAQIDQLAASYVELMITEEWPAMARLDFNYAASHRVVQSLWNTVSRTQTRTASEETSRDHTLTELSQMTEHRRLRQLEATNDLPLILWAVLIAGAIVTIVSACLFGGSDFRLHFIQVAALSLMLALVLVTIADINRPFQGSVHIKSTGFERARVTLRDYLQTR